MLIYKIDILQCLKDSGYNTVRLRKEKLLGENAIQAIRKNEMIGTRALDKVCGLLELQPGDIIQYVNEKKLKPGKSPGFFIAFFCIWKKTA